MNALERWSPIIGLIALLLPSGLASQTPEPAVHAVLFYSPTCPHCHQVITEHLIPLQNQHGSRLVLLGMDTSQPWASNLYWEAIRHFELPQEDWAVPLLIVGEEVLVGGFEIPNRFPEILERGLKGQGIDLPDYPAMVSFLKEQDMLDPRYPDRLVTRPSPTPGEEASPPAPDSAGAEDMAEPGVSPQGPDTITVAEDTAPVTVAGEDTVAPATPPEILPDSGSIQDSAPEKTESEGVEDALREGGPARDTSGRARESAPGDTLARMPPTERPSAEEPGRPADTGAGVETAPEAGGGFGLEAAARDLESMTMGDRFALDPAGNTLSVVVLLGMILTLVLRGYPPRVEAPEWPAWVIPALVLVGTGVASYLSFIEVTHAEAVCGPVGDCNTVNQSEYAYLFGVLPVGILGLVGYGVILVLWVLRHSGSGQTHRRATLALWGAALLGTVFSVYLTFLEPFVIGATCAWCLTSAVIMTLLLWAASPMAARVWPGGSRALS